jgi:hypothetical protein
MTGKQACQQANVPGGIFQVVSLPGFDEHQNG